MRILLLADVHSNWPALRAVIEHAGRFDQCFFLGDAVDYACNPAPCIDWLRENADAAVRGNHDHSVAQRVLVRPGGTFRRMSSSMRPLHFKVLNDEQLTWLARLPVTQHVNVDSRHFFLVHATPRDPMDEYLPAESSPWEQRLDHVEADFVCVGHTHVPMHLTLPSGMQIVNPGSVGQPRDGDPRAAYAVVEDGNLVFHRVEYDVDETVDGLRQGGISDEVVLSTERVLRAGGRTTDSGL